MTTFSGRWIPVTEQMPDDDITVMVAAPTMDHPWCIAYLVNGKWYDDLDGWTIYGVTHWAEMVPGPQGCGTDGMEGRKT